MIQRNKRGLNDYLSMLSHRRMLQRGKKGVSMHDHGSAVNSAREFAQVGTKVFDFS